MDAIHRKLVLQTAFVFENGTGIVVNAIQVLTNFIAKKIFATFEYTCQGCSDFMLPYECCGLQKQNR